MTLLKESSQLLHLKLKYLLTENLQTWVNILDLGIEGGGCSGFNYLLDIAEEVEDDDIHFQ